jgi:hypothetical protein
MTLGVNNHGLVVGSQVAEANDNQPEGILLVRLAA